MNGQSNWSKNDDEKICTKLNFSAPSRAFIVGLLRVRNEELILQDTLNHLAEIVDYVVAYDDASTDATFDILWGHPSVSAVVRNHVWRRGVEERLSSETRHRGLLLNVAKSLHIFDWCLCADADERYVGAIRRALREDVPADCEGIRIRLFDAYITRDDSAPYQFGDQLFNFRRKFGPERRDILMLWRNKDTVRFEGLDAREPTVTGKVESKFFCQHYGKSLSVEHWEETCTYYVENFPYDPYGKKWEARRGRAIHTKSDFDRPLYSWGSELFSNAVTAF